MKQKFLIILMVFTFVKGSTQVVNFPIDKETGRVAYTEVVDVPGVTKSKLYSKANDWIKINYFSGKDRVLTGKFEDAVSINQEEGKIICWGGFRATSGSTGLLSTCGEKKFTIVYTVTIFTKDNKFKYEITAITFQEYNSGNWVMPVPTGYGISLLGGSTGEKVIETPIEEIYPINKVKKCDGLYEKALPAVDKEIREKIKSLIAYMKKSDDW